jgi:uncharacterized protein YggE
METTSTPLSPKVKVSLVIVGIVCITSIVVVSILRDAIINPSVYSFSDTGIGKVTYTPNKAEIIFGVQISRAETAEAALSQLNEQGDAIEMALRTFGIASGDITVQSYSINPYYDWSEEAGSFISGYDAYQQYVVVLRELQPEDTRVRDLVESVTRAGINQVQSIQFSTDNVEELIEEAKLLAITDAKENATVTASSLGVKLGKVTGWWKNNDYETVYYGEKGGYGNEMDTSASGYIPAGAQEIVVEATVTFEMK